MADDDDPRAGIEQHLRRRAAGMRALLRMMHVLPADREIGNEFGCAMDQRRRHAEPHIHTRMAGCSRSNGLHLRQIGGRSVHLPVADDEFPDCHVFPPFARR
jgi:hypothetical protein